MREDIKNKARSLRKNLTDAERALWKHLRLRHMRGCKFRKQQPIGPYIVDFVCFDNKMVVDRWLSNWMEDSTQNRLIAIQNELRG